VQEKSVLQFPRISPYESPFQVTLKGVAAGLVGTLAMTTALQVVARLLPAPNPEAARDPDDYSGIDELASLDDSAPVPPTEQVAERLAHQMFGTELSQETRQRLGVGIHWAYGAFWGALSAQVQLTARPPAVPYGVGLGLLVWAVGPGRLVPALGIYARPSSSGLVRRLLAIALHVLYGVTTAVTLERLSTSR
jgi:hypothetical protein